MRLDRFVEGGTVYLSFNTAHHVGDFFGSFADECNHEMDVGGVGGHAVGDLLEDGGLAGLGRGDDESALSAANGGYEVDEPGGKLGALAFELDVFVRGDGREVFEVRVVRARYQDPSRLRYRRE